MVEEKIRELEINAKEEKSDDEEAAYVIKPEYDEKNSRESQFRQSRPHKCLFQPHEPIHYPQS